MRMPKEKLIELLKRVVTAIEANESVEGSIVYTQTSESETAVS